MKNGLSFLLLAATVFAGLILSLVDASRPRENSPTAAEVSAPATVAAHTATPSGSLALSDR